MIGYYYCSVPTFHNIIYERQLYLSDPLKMNDSGELRWFINQAVKYVEENEPSLKDTAAEAVKSFDSLVGNGQRFTYIGCFSKEPDLLSQWRGYAADATGVALGFELFDLKALNKRIDYKNVKYRSGFTSEDRDVILYVIKMLAENKQDDDEWKCTIYKELLPIMAEYKADGFKEEKEIRLTYWTGDRPHRGEYYVPLKSEEKLDRKYRIIGDSNITGYVELDFEKKLNALKEVVLGPKCKITEFDIKDYILLRWGVFPVDRIKVYRSKIAYQ